MHERMGQGVTCRLAHWSNISVNVSTYAVDWISNVTLWYQPSLAVVGIAPWQSFREPICWLLDWQHYSITNRSL